MHFQASMRAISAVLFLVSGGGATAGVITSIGSSALPGFSTGSIGPVGANPAPNNDNTPSASANTIPYSIFFNSPGAAEVEFLVEASGGSTEYFVTQSLINNTGQAWTGFVFELGFGTGPAFARALPGVLLDFDSPNADPAPFSSVFGLLDHQSHALLWNGGTVPSIGGVLFRLSLDVPDGFGTFTLRQTPITAASEVPEPSGIILMAGALLALAATIRQRRQPTGPY